MSNFLLNTFLLIGSIQGFIFTLIVWNVKKFRSKSNLFLSFLILSFSLNNLQYYLIHTELISSSTFFNFIYIPYGSINMVFLFFYIKFLLFPQGKIRKIEYLLFIPFLLFFIASLYYKIGKFFTEFQEATLSFFSNLLAFHEFFSAFYSIVLLMFSFQMIIKFEKNKNFNSQIISLQKIKWLKVICGIALLLCGIWIFSIIQEFIFNYPTSHYYYLLCVGISFIIYILGHFSLFNFEINSKKKSKLKSHSDLKTEKSKHIIEFEKFISQEKNYLNPQLSLELSADHLQINKSYLSRIINSELNTSFSAYINQLRVKEAESYLAQKEYNDYPLSIVGLEAGFNSKSVFNTCFKKYTGLTPSEYRKKVNSSFK